MIDPIKVQGVRETLQLLDAVQPGSLTALRKDIVRLTEPAVSAIRARIPATAPLSGMSHYGRTRYAGAKVKASLDLRSSKYGNDVSLVKIEVASPKLAAGLEIADMAGRKRMVNGPGLPYEYKGIGRRGGSGRQNPTRSRSVVRRGNSAPFSYRITGQGKGMMDNLGGVPSRYVYPALAGKVEGLASAMLRTVETYTAKINQKIKVM